jgi:hypothetical protein
MIDYDNDGNLDLFLVNGSRLEGFGTGSAPTNHLFRNTGRKAGRVVFEDVTKRAGLAHSGWGNGVAAGDIDNDGNVDLYITYWGAEPALSQPRRWNLRRDWSQKSGTARTGEGVEFRCDIFRL